MTLELFKSVNRIVSVRWNRLEGSSPNDYSSAMNRQDTHLPIRLILAFAMLAIVTMPLGAIAQEQNEGTQPLTLRVAHDLAPTDASAAFFFAPWAREIAAATQNTLEIEYVVEPELSDPAARLDALANGTIDAALIPVSALAAQAPAATALDLPMLFPNDPELTSRVAWRFGRDHLAKELPEMQFIAIFSNGPMVLHTKGRRMAEASRFEGLKTHVSGPIASRFMELLGAAPEIMQFSEAPGAMARSKIEGAFAPWHIMSTGDPLKDARRHMEIGGDTAIFVGFEAFVVSQKAMASLPPVIAEVILARSGEDTSVRVGAAIATGTEIGRAHVKRQPRSINFLPETELVPLRMAAAEVQGNWLRAMLDADYPAKIWLLDLNKSIQDVMR